MLFTLTVAAAASQALSLRPAFTASARSAHFARLQDFAKVVRSSNSVAALHEAAGVVNDILVQEGNATMHLEPPEMDILREVIRIIGENMYGRMDTAQDFDSAALAEGIAAINRCSQDWTHRIEEGDLYSMRGRAISYQNDLNELQEDVDAKTLANATAWNNLATHMALISDAPACPALPHPRIMQSLDVYFESSAYVTWYIAQSEAYWPLREAFREADRLLQVALAAYAVGLGRRDVAYCDWRREMEEGCAAYTECYHLARAAYIETLNTVVENMFARMEIYKAGETIIHQIRFLLAEEADQQTPAIDPAPYVMSNWPDIPPFTECDMSPLYHERWVPAPECPDMCDESVDLGHLQDGYRGCQTHTRGGHLCLEWTQHWIDTYPGKGVGRHNRCRNPDHEPEGIWCLKVGGGWEYCDPIPPPPVPPAPPTPAPGTWAIHGDGCEAAGECVQSMNYPSEYGNRQSCSIELFGEVAVRVSDGFSTELNFDKLFVGGAEFHGELAPNAVAQLNGVYSGNITWHTDHSVVRSGWQLCLSPAQQCLEAVSNEADAGYVDDFRGWYDVQGCGQCNDYCRWVGNGGPGGNPSQRQRHGESWWSCRLAGTDRVYSGRDHFSSWAFQKCSGRGAMA
jgi:hypothetical protein